MKMLNGRTPKYLAEAIGTFILVFAGCGAVCVNGLTHGALTSVGISLVFGLVVLAMVYTIGHISGAHMNPAVTLGFFSAGRLPKQEVPLYIGAQVIGAILAAACLRIIFPMNIAHWGVTVPSGSWLQSFFIEYLFTLILMFVVMGVATDHRAEGTMAGVAIGATICFEALVGGPISGASMNPARSFGPALISGQFQHHWIYWVAPILGSLSGAAIYRVVACHSSAAPPKSGCC